MSEAVVGESVKPDCIFCRIALKEIPAETVHDDGDVLVFKDAHPQAPTHLLAIPRRHVRNVTDLDDQVLMGKLFAVAAQQGRTLKKGFRLVVNNGGDGGQQVDHLHIHILGGRQLNWPPG